MSQINMSFKNVETGCTYSYKEVVLGRKISSVVQGTTENQDDCVQRSCVIPLVNMNDVDVLSDNSTSGVEHEQASKNSVRCVLKSERDRHVGNNRRRTFSSTSIPSETFSQPDHWIDDDLVDIKILETELHVTTIAKSLSGNRIKMVVEDKPQPSTISKISDMLKKAVYTEKEDSTPYACCGSLRDTMELLVTPDFNGEMRSSSILVDALRPLVKVHPAVEHVISNVEGIFVFLATLNMARSYSEVMVALVGLYKMIDMPAALFKKYKSAFKLMLKMLWPQRRPYAAAGPTPVEEQFNPFSRIREWIEDSESVPDSFSLNFFTITGFIASMVLAAAPKGGASLALTGFMKFCTSKTKVVKPSPLNALLFVLEGGWQALVYKDLTWIHSGRNYREWYKKVNLLASKITKYAIIECGDDPDYRTLDMFRFALDEARKTGDNIQIMADRQEYAGSVYPIVARKLGTLEKVAKTYKQFRAGKNARICPFVTMLYGKSGGGKSVMTAFLFEEFARHRKFRNLDSTVYDIMASSRFYEGYDGQKQCLMNDPDSLKQGNSELAGARLTLLQDIVDNNKCRLNMPGLDEKGVTFFESEHLLLTTNHLPLRVEGLFSDPTAMHRRLSYAIEVLPTTYLKSSGDFHIKEFEIDDVSALKQGYVFNIYSYSPAHNNKYVVVKSGLNFFEMLKDFHERIDAHFKRQDTVIRNNALVRSSPTCVHNHNMLFCEACLSQCTCFDVYEEDCPFHGPITFAVPVCQHKISIRCCPQCLTEECLCVPEDIPDPDCPKCVKLKRLELMSELPHSVSLLGNVAAAVTATAMVFNREDYNRLRRIQRRRTHASDSGSENEIHTFYHRVRYWKHTAPVSYRLAILTMSHEQRRGYRQYCARKLALNETGYIMRDFEEEEFIVNLGNKRASIGGTDMAVIAEIFVKAFAVGLVVKLLFDKMMVPPRKPVEPSFKLLPRLALDQEDIPIAAADMKSYKEESQSPFSGNKVAESTTSGTYNTLVEKSLFKIFIKTEGYEGSCVALCLSPGVFITVKHIFHKDETVITYVSDPAKKVSYAIPRKNVSFCEEQDLAFFYMPAIKCSTRLHRFLMQENYDFSVFDATYHQAKPQGKVVGPTDKKDVTCGFMRELTYKAPPGSYQNGMATCKQVFAWRGLSPVGNCGSVLSYRNDANSLLVGLVFAASSNEFEYATFATQLTGELYRSHVLELAKSLQARAVSKVSDDMLYWPEFAKRVSVLELYKRSTLRYADKPLEEMKIYGTITNMGSSMDTRFYHSPFYDLVESKTGVPGKYTVPYFKSDRGTRVSPTLYNVNLLFKDKSSFLQEDIDWARNDYLSGLPSVPPMQPVGLFGAINGACGEPRMKLSTSAGFPYRGSKRNRMVKKSETVWELSEEDERTYMHMHCNYRMGVQCRPVFLGSHKDEIVSKKKNDEGAIRMFQASSHFLLLDMRNYFLPIIGYLKENRWKAEMAIGINSFSSQWAELFDFLCEGGLDKRIVAGDYSKFDKTMQEEVIISAFDILIEIARRAGYSKGDLLAMRTLAKDIARYVCVVKNDVFEVVGNPSGQCLTTIINCLVNCLYYRIVFHKLYPKLTFREAVKLITYGDDSILSVRKGYDKFNHSEILRIFAMHNIKYTMAQKEKKSVPFIPISEADFLKRKFVVTQLRGERVIVDPLNPESIFRSLAFFKSNKLSKSERAFEAVMNAEREFVRQPSNSSLRAVLDDIWIRLTASTNGFISQAIVDGEQITFDVMSGKNADVSFYSIYNGEEYDVPIEDIRESRTERSKLREQGRSDDVEIIKDASLPICPIMDDDRIKQNFPISLAGGELTYPALLSLPKTVADINNTDVTIDDHPVVSFYDSGNVRIAELPLEERHVDKLDGFLQTSIDEFFSRPVQISSNTWSYGAGFQLPLDPWSLWRTNTLVDDKMKNFHLWRGKLHVKIVVNGSPFHLGRLHIGYRPQFTAQGNWDGILNNRMELRRIVMLPGTRDSPIAPNKSESFEITLPFFFPFPYANTAVATFADFGRLQIFSNDFLETANLVASDVTITTTAWMEDLSVVVPQSISSNSAGDTFMTAVNSALNPTGAAIDDQVKTAAVTLTEDRSEEEPDGMISTTTQAFADAAGSLKVVPYIGGLMGPAQNALNTASSVARYFGFSQPQVLTDPSFYRNQPFSELATVNGNMTYQRLTYDKKQAVSIDPGSLNLPSDDDMTFAKMKGTWSLMDSFAWAPTDLPGASLFQFLVTPAVLAVESVVGPPAETFHQLSSVYQSVMPFAFWSRGMEYKLIVASSQMQSGRLAITYQPNDVLHRPQVTNEQIIRIVDIKETDETYFDVGWAQDIAWKEIPTAKSIGELYSPLGVIYNTDVANGSVQISVYSMLRGPGAASIVCYLFCRGAPDLITLAPNINPNLQFLECFPETISGELGDTFVGAEASSEELTVQTKLYGGDTLASLRSLLKRSFLWKTQAGVIDPAVGDMFTLRLEVGSFPTPRTQVVPVIWQGVWGVGANTVGTSFMAIYRNCYAGWNGSIRHKYMLEWGGHPETDVQHFWASRNPQALKTPGNYAAPGLTQEAVTNGVLANTIYNTEPIGGNQGTAATYRVNQGVIETEYPSYIPRKYMQTDWARSNRANTPESSVAGQVYVRGAHRVSLTIFETWQLADYVAAGEDFSFFWYLGGGTYKVI